MKLPPPADEAVNNPVYDPLEVDVDENVEGIEGEGIEEAENFRAHEDIEDAPFFKDLPVYIDRYDFVSRLLADNRWSKKLRRVVDVGANNCQFLFRLRNSYGMRYLREVIALDVDEYLLESCGYKTAPLSCAHMIREHRRSFYPLDIYHMCGSIGDQDERLANMDVVIGIEVIEHLHQETLDALPENVFGHMKPKIAVFTTPNREFNVLFPGFTGPFRHWDHKFEWTRSEFQEWAGNIIRDYPDYEVRFDGVGKAPDHVHERGGDVGFCSQIAVFTRKDFLTEANNGEFVAKECVSTLDTNINLVENHIGGRYKIVVHHRQALDRDERSKEQKAFDAVSNSLCNRFQDLVEEDEGNNQALKVYCSELRVPLEAHCYDKYGDPYDIDDQTLGEIIGSRDGYKMGEDELGVYVTITEDHWINQSNDEEDEEDELYYDREYRGYVYEDDADPDPNHEDDYAPAVAFESDWDKRSTGSESSVVGFQER